MTFLVEMPILYFIRTFVKIESVFYKNSSSEIIRSHKCQRLLLKTIYYNELVSKKNERNMQYFVTKLN